MLISAGINFIALANRVENILLVKFVLSFPCQSTDLIDKADSESSVMNRSDQCIEVGFTAL